MAGSTNGQIAGNKQTGKEKSDECATVNECAAVNECAKDVVGRTDMLCGTADVDRNKKMNEEVIEERNEERNEVVTGNSPVITVTGKDEADARHSATNESNGTSSSSSDASTNHLKYHNMHILDNMSDEDMHRYESFRRSGISKTAIKKLVTHVLNQACNPNFIIAMSGIAKVFVGEVVIKAKEVQERWNETGPLTPSHVHEAYRLLYKDMPNMRVYRRYFE